MIASLRLLTSRLVSALLSLLPFRVQKRLRKSRKRIVRRMRLVRSLGVWAIPAERQLRRAEHALEGYVSVSIGFGRRIVLRAATTDTNVFRQHFVERELYAIPRLGGASVIVDLGAHIGLATEVLRRNYPDARIVSVEMDPENFALCARNHRETVAQESIHAAIWSCGGVVYIDDVGEGNWAFRVRGVSDADPGDPSTGSAVPAMSFVDLIREQRLERISILKVDIEGSEAELFESAWRDILQMTDLVVMEIHDWIPGVRERVEVVLQQARREFDLDISQAGEFTCIRPTRHEAEPSMPREEVASA